MPALKVLTQTEIDQFVNEGYVYLRNAFPAEASEAIRAEIWSRIGLSPDEPAAWDRQTVGLQETLTGEICEPIFTDRLIHAYDDVLGEGRYKLWKEQGWWPVTFPGFAEKPWTPPDDGWHVDGGFHHHVYSRDQGLLPIFIHSQIDEGDGGTAILPGSHRMTARKLVESAPVGMTVKEICEFSFHTAKANLNDAVEVNGSPGDVVLMHPFMMHTSSKNTGSRVRFICNPKVVLHDHMNLQRDDAANYSPVERAIVEAAGDLLEAMEPAPQDAV